MRKNVQTGFSSDPVFVKTWKSFTQLLLCRGAMDLQAINKTHPFYIQKILTQKQITTTEPCWQRLMYRSIFYASKKNHLVFFCFFPNPSRKSFSAQLTMYLVSDVDPNANRCCMCVYNYKGCSKSAPLFLTS